MKFKKERDEEPVEVKYITIYIGEHRFRLTETNEGRLNIIKYSDGFSDNISIHPCVANSIDIS